MFSSLRSRLWLSYAFIVVTALTVVTIVLFISLYRNPLMYRQTTERLKAVQIVLTERLNEGRIFNDESILERSARTFNVRVIIFSSDGAVIYDSTPQTASLRLPEFQIKVRSLPVIRDTAGKAWLYSVGKLQDGNLLMVASLRPRLSVLNLFSDDFLPVILLGGMVALLLSLVAAFLISGWIADPLQRVVTVAHEMPLSNAKPIELSGPIEVQELTRAFNSMVLRLQAGQRSQRAFVANVSHEMKTPLTSIQGFAQALLDGTASSTESRLRAAQVIYSEAERMHRMVVDLLDLARMDAGTTEMKMSAVDACALLNAQAEKFSPQSMQSGVEISINCPPFLPTLIADGDRIAQVLTNLIDNALKFTPRGKRVTLSAFATKSEMHLVVADAGVGIPEKDLPFVLQRFYQADPSRQGGTAHGAGLGLAIVEEIISAHGGRIDIQSRLGAGTSIEITIPLLPPLAHTKPN